MLNIRGSQISRRLRESAKVPSPSALLPRMREFAVAQGEASAKTGGVSIKAL
jgi:hypothetical protein